MRVTSVRYNVKLVHVRVSTEGANDLRWDVLNH
jgi:hypothetical protein